MNRAKIVIISVSAVFVIALVVLGVIVKGKYDTSAEARDSRDYKARELENVFRQEIFPSQANVKALRENLAELEAAREALSDRLIEFNVAAPTNASSPVFVRKLRDLVENKVKKAPVVEGKKCVANDFGFGFERYLGQSPAMPMESQVPRLFQQLIIVSKLTDILFDAGVIQIKSIGREPFDGAPVVQAQKDDEDDSPRARGRGKKRRASAASDDNAEGAAVEGYSINEKLYMAQHFTLQVVARQNSMMDILNHIASMDDVFAVVTDIKIRKTGNDVRVPGASAENDKSGSSRGGRSSRNARSEQERSDDAMPLMSDLPAGQRLISGPEIDAPLDVTIDIDVYGFKKEAE